MKKASEIFKRLLRKEHEKKLCIMENMIFEGGDKCNKIIMIVQK